MKIYGELEFGQFGHWNFRLEDSAKRDRLNETFQRIDFIAHLAASAVDERYQITAANPHMVSNRGPTDRQFLLLQGVGRYDWKSAEV